LAQDFFAQAVSPQVPERSRCALAAFPKAEQMVFQSSVCVVAFVLPSVVVHVSAWNCPVGYGGPDQCKDDKCNGWSPVMGSDSYPGECIPGDDPHTKCKLVAMPGGGNIWEPDPACCSCWPFNTASLATAEVRAPALRGAANASAAALGSGSCTQLSGTYCAGQSQECNCNYCDDFCQDTPCARTCRILNNIFHSPAGTGCQWWAASIHNPNPADGSSCSWMEGDGEGGKGDDCRQCDEYAMKCRRANPAGNCRAS